MLFSYDIKVTYVTLKSYLKNVFPSQSLRASSPSGGAFIKDIFAQKGRHLGSLALQKHGLYCLVELWQKKVVFSTLGVLDG